ncbi:hypothetical protein [Aureimonas sp. AU22]|uniref:hypothetical protein n=1 Tax=Aureimonas sp. AU22 TaxID=1638162 RepID=UPI0012E3903B|nr:hypothetical protein [Aureimonas sp. AU22]
MPMPARRLVICRIIQIAILVLVIGAIAVYAYRWFTPDTAADLARTGQCEQYRQADQRLEAGLDSEVNADPTEIDMVMTECERQGH